MVLKIEVTKFCNQSCLHCSFSRKYSNETTHLNLDGLKEQITSLRTRNLLPKKFHVTLSGGEPLLNPELFAMVTYLRSVGAKHIALATNALPLISNPELQKQLDESSINEVVVSLSTSNEDYFEIRGARQESVINELLRIKQSNPDKIVTGNYLVHKQSLPSLQKLMSSTKDLPFHEIRFLTYKSELSPKESPLYELSTNSENSLEKLVNKYNGSKLNFIKNRVLSKFFNIPHIPIFLLKVLPTSSRNENLSISA